MTLRWFIVAQSPSAYMLSHPSTRSHSSVAKTRLLACFKETQLLNEVVNEHKKDQLMKF